MPAGLCGFEAQQDAVPAVLRPQGQALAAVRHEAEHAAVGPLVREAGHRLAVVEEVPPSAHCGLVGQAVVLVPGEDLLEGLPAGVSRVSGSRSNLGTGGGLGAVDDILVKARLPGSGQPDPFGITGSSNF